MALGSYRRPMADWHNVCTLLNVRSMILGTLVVDLFDSKTKTLIWRGSASDTLSDKSDKNIKHLDTAVDKLFEHFPPGEKN